MKQWLVGLLLLYCLVLAGCSNWKSVNPYEHQYQQVQEHGGVEGGERKKKHDKHDKQANPSIPPDLGLSDTPGP